ncbi:ATP-binding protein [Treponema phagedenis]|uniref:ATP-binding protein n=2 Tax=Treponema phagedenis TaxID=162 RepID=UPI001CA43EB6|nr:ATP-binding protein [Treponema phagedenis]
MSTCISFGGMYITVNIATYPEAINAPAHVKIANAKTRSKQMAVVVMVIGESGTGKSTSLRNFKRGEASIVNISKKPLPFKSELTVLKSDNYAEIMTVLKRAAAKSIVIDDCQYLMAFEFMNRAKEKGFEKFTDIGSNFFQLIQTAINLPDDKIIYFLSHIEQLDGREKCKTIGKLLDEKITLEGLFTIVLKTVVAIDGNNQRQFCFATINNGADTVKSPMGMFDSPLIPNDLKAVDRTIREYYSLPANEGAPAQNKSKQTQNKETTHVKPSIMQFAR